jgi:hypothetical protein
MPIVMPEQEKVRADDRVRAPCLQEFWKAGPVSEMPIETPNWE